MPKSLSKSPRIAALVMSLALTAFAGEAAAAATIAVAKSAACGCCDKWVEHMRKAGFTVNAANVEDVGRVANRLGVPAELRSCHTARVGKYVIEGHVPASDIKRLLKEQPSATGLAVAGMPLGSPGMEAGTRREAYKTMLFGSAGTRVFASH